MENIHASTMSMYGLMVHLSVGGAFCIIVYIMFVLMLELILMANVILLEHFIVKQDIIGAKIGFLLGVLLEALLVNITLRID